VGNTRHVQSQTGVMCVGWLQAALSVALSGGTATDDVIQHRPLTDGMQYVT
jgi:hypothetical protein